jgi:hypothetical protein
MFYFGLPKREVIVNQEIEFKSVVPGELLVRSSNDVWGLSQSIAERMPGVHFDLKYLATESYRLTFDPASQPEQFQPMISAVDKPLPEPVAGPANPAVFTGIAIVGHFSS